MSNLNIGFMKNGRARWQEAEATKDFNIALTRQDKKFLTSELFKVIQGAIPLILHFKTMLFLNKFFEYFYNLGCAINVHYQKVVIDSGRTKFKQGKTDGILYSREFHE